MQIDPSFSWLLLPPAPTQYPSNCLKTIPGCILSKRRAWARCQPARLRAGSSACVHSPTPTACMLQFSAGELSFHLSKKSLSAPCSLCVTQRKGCDLKFAGADINDSIDETERPSRSESRKMNFKSITKPYSDGFDIAASSMPHPEPRVPRTSNSSVRRWLDISGEAGV